MPAVRAATTRGRLCVVVAAALASTTTALAAPHATRDLILPAHARTPGVTNPAVTKATIGTTICVKNWTKSIRPPASYTNALKAKQMLQYNESGPATDYEEDHLIPLELGGAPKDPRNLWPEPHTQSKVTDPLETKLNRMICVTHTLTLAAARKQILAFKRTKG
jgi:hypothetical protein